MIKSDKKNLIFNFLTVIIIFFLDRLSKIYILKLAEFENTLDIYVLPNLNFYLVWNKGISFGLLPFSNSFGYLALTFLVSLFTFNTSVRSSNKPNL